VRNSQSLNICTGFPSVYGTPILQYPVRNSQSMTVNFQYPVHYSPSSTAMFQYPVHYSPSLTAMFQYPVHYSPSLTAMFQYPVQYSSSIIAMLGEESTVPTVTPKRRFRKINCKKKVLTMKK